MNDPQTAYNNGWACILILSVYCMLYLVIAAVAVVQSIFEKEEEEARYRYTVEMKIKVVLVRLFTQQGVRDELLAKADGVEYVSKAGSSLTVVTRSQSKMDFTTKRSDGLEWGTSGTNNMRSNASNGEMRLPDDDEMLDNSPIRRGNGDFSPTKMLLESEPPTPIMIKNNFSSPFGVGGNDAALPSIFQHKPKIDPRMLATPSALNKITYPKV